ncbi:hypothetical protein Vadar_028922 [Vaccinium darrowii]|uniref:Uncharacterized protein n=1 Tax=Vaccinium darrowii TaxID=229202 RepID=A0ACB7Z7V9_9ERIC|nr:hypothetical protein Vadar_028922 [Vaccinium darrowii]
MKIKVKESTIVKPSKETPKHILTSSYLDLLVTPTHVPTIYVYKPNGSKNFFDTQLLKEALSNCLVVFYPMAGRLRRREGNVGGFDIDCNGEGVLFVEAESEGVIDDFGDFTPCFDLEQLIPTVDKSDQSFSITPLLILQITHFKCGGASLGVGFNHALVDATTGLHFINSWSDVARGASITIPPVIDRSLLCSRDPPSPTYHHIEYDPPSSMNNPIQTKKCETSSKPTSTVIIKITRDQLNTLKASITKDEKNPVRYSTYETLAAHVWRCTSIARGLVDDQATELYIATDARSRLHPPLPPGYLGNAIFPTILILSAGDLRSKPLKWAAEKIHDTLSRRNNDYLQSVLDYLALQPDPSAMGRGPESFKFPNLNVVSWFRLPAYNADFGWGPPIHFGPTDTPCGGVVHILRSPTGDGSLSLVICLETDYIEAFKTVFYDF